VVESAFNLGTPLWSSQEISTNFYVLERLSEFLKFYNIYFLNLVIACGLAEGTFMYRCLSA